MPKLSQKKRFSIIARARSVKHALRGIGIIFKTQHNAWVHGVIALIVIGLGFWLQISEGEWAVILLSITSVLAAEAFNTAMEIDIDLTSPTYHPYARDTKDVASGAVLITALGAAIVGIVVFVPKLWTLFH
ncbi:MAG: diacylglycerol kinase family protein [Candidatus Pacebacteria bacterium]|jgi:diacylglycerol kinase (ATP)|nr:diacylglycerol kinase family protein [Candidatus Paceibacterota bacterium]MBP9700974.1 diacylglycerol kinase family protein [Candidatus Paceibacterota bacterium]